MFRITEKEALNPTVTRISVFAPDIAKKALKIASEICVFTNDNIRCESVGTPLLPAAEKTEEKANETAAEARKSSAKKGAKKEDK